MKKVNFYLDTGFGASCIHEDYIEFDDSVSDEEITEELTAWANDQIDAWWEEEKE